MTAEEIVAALDRGEPRVAEKRDGDWVVDVEAKEAILAYFRLREMQPIEVGPFEYLDKIPLSTTTPGAGCASCRRRRRGTARSCRRTSC